MLMRVQFKVINFMNRQMRVGSVIMIPKDLWNLGLKKTWKLSYLLELKVREDKEI